MDEENKAHDELEDLPMTWEEAAHTLETEAVSRKDFIDDVYPWWQTLRRPFFVLSLVIAILCASVIFLSVTVRSLYMDRNHEQDQDACFDTYSNRSSQAIAEVRAAATRVDNAGWSALIRSANGEEISDDEVDHVEELTVATEEALATDEQRIKERDNWVAAGRPLPCPVTDEPG